MPAEAIAIALPGAFMACVQCFELVQFGRNFKEDFAISAADLKICEIHLLRWGAAAGLDEGDTTELPKKLSQYPEAQLQKGLLVLNRIVSIFNTTKESCQFDSVNDDEEENNEAGTEPLNEDDQLQGQQPNMRKSHKHLDKVKAMYRSAASAVKHAAQSASDRTKWALYKKKHFTALVDQVGKLIDRLEKLIPELLEVEKKLAKEEADGVEKEVLQVLPALAAKIDSVMAEAFKAQGRSLGMTFENVEAGEYSRTQLGNTYAPGEKSTGHDDHQFKGLKIGGNAVFHGGNSYGVRRDDDTTAGAEKDGKVSAQT